MYTGAPEQKMFQSETIFLKKKHNIISTNTKPENAQLLHDKNTQNLGQSYMYVYVYTDRSL